MSELAELLKKLDDSEPAIPSEDYSTPEKILIWVLLFAVAGFSISFVLFTDVVWGEYLKPFVWDPIVDDASVAGDAGYNVFNTVLYTALMFICVIAFQAFFRKWNIPSDDTILYALIAWVCLAPVLRVLEDGHFFIDGADILFISPIIHIHLAGWLILTALFSRLVISDKKDKTNQEIQSDNYKLIILILATTLLFWRLLLYPSHQAESGLGLGNAFVYAGLALGMISTIYIISNTSDWNPISRGLLSFATGTIIFGLGYYCQMALYYNDQYIGDDYNEIVFWPALVVLGIPALVTYGMWRYGRDDLRQIRLAGYDAGVIPLGVRVKTWEAMEEEVKIHPVELLSRKATVASPMVLAMTFGQLCDGFATMMGLDFFGYGEKHVASDNVIQYGGRINEVVGISWGVGAWFFTLVKALLVTAVVYVFANMRIERRHQHMRLLIVLAIMIVGLAPGLRDIGRLMLDI